MSVLLNQGNGTFATAISYAAGSNPITITAADLNSDGKPDLAVVNYSTKNVCVLLNQGSGTFATAVDYGVG